MARRFRKRKCAPGQIRVYWGKLPYDSRPDVIYQWGDGCSKRDGALLHYVLGSQRPGVLEREWEPSLLDDLTARGYDITTLEFSIRKHPATPERV